MINAIVAVDSNQGIGINNSLPWPHLHYDMLWFKNMTDGQYILMGRNTWESLGKRTLPNRKNIVVSSRVDFDMDIWMQSVDDALEYYKIYAGNKELFIIGGAKVYEQCLDKVDRWYVTEINKRYECDSYLDLDNIKTKFKNKIEIASFESPVEYKIYEYNNDTSRS